MNRVAVLSKKGLAARPYDRWLGPTCEVILFANEEDESARQMAENDGTGLFSRILLFPDWKSSYEIERSIIAEHDRCAINRIIALSESDQIRAAELRQLFGLAGQHVDSARAFRDKVLMKTIARSAGLPVPALSVIKTIDELLEFANGKSGSVVLKPIDGSGSAGVHVLPIEERTTWETTVGLKFDLRTQYLVEEFIEGPVLSVDGVMADGQIIAATVSTYTLDCYSSLVTMAPHGLLQLRADDLRAQRAVNYVEKLLDAMPCPSETRSFHCEIFDHAERGAILCEIACRTGGGRINDIARLSLHVDLDHWATLGQAGFAPTRILPQPRRSEHLMGDVLFPAPGGRLKRAPDSCPLSEVIDYNIRPKIGEIVPRARKTSEYVVDVLFQANDRPSLESAYQSVSDWIRSEVVWD